MNSRPILYVEDEQDDVFFMEHVWGQAGGTNPLKVVNNGEQAVQYLSGEGKYADRAISATDARSAGFEIAEVARLRRAEMDSPPIGDPEALPVIIFSSPAGRRTSYRLRSRSEFVSNKAFPSRGSDRNGRQPERLLARPQPNAASVIAGLGPKHLALPTRSCETTQPLPRANVFLRRCTSGPPLPVASTKHALERDMELALAAMNKNESHLADWRLCFTARRRLAF